MNVEASSDSAARVGVERRPEGLTIRLAGRLDAQTTGAAWRTVMKALSETQPRQLDIDASALAYCDGSGAALLLAIERDQHARAAAFSLRGLDPELARFVERMRPPEGEPPPPPPARPGLREGIESLGLAALEIARDLRDLVAYTGELSAALAWAVTHPRRVRWRDVFLTARQAGANALPIIALVGFLMGLILAFQSAVQLRRFAAEIFVADAVGLSLVRELGALMTAVILAGRSGSAFAAELGTMKVNEELDALETMGLEPVRFLVVTRVTASVVMTPFLVAFFNLAGLVGGWVVVVSLGFPTVLFVNRVAYAVVLGDLFGGLFKSLVFAVLVTAVGCARGLQTGLGARAVGESATSAVVSGIVLIAVADGVLSVVYYVLGI